ncbi:hypothetical protein [Acetobacter pasteurianus]|uniref:hypothetical protein n=1 Tax=Acetobacter pasteurianus TaxID=438 RepID=UPI000415D034|nr:hypothetical protein [Acetobacter pasteurianus]
MPDLKDLWRLVQVMNEIKAWRFTVIMFVFLITALAFAIEKALPGVAAIIQACR